MDANYERDMDTMVDRDDDTLPDLFFDIDHLIANLPNDAGTTTTATIAWSWNPGA